MFEPRPARGTQKPMPSLNGSGRVNRLKALEARYSGRSLIGTRHLRGDASARSVTVTREEVVQFVDELNPLLGRFRLCGSDVLGVFAGLLPERQANTAHVDLERAPRIVDHAGSGRRGVYSVIGVKWTTSHVVARSVVATVCAYLGKPQSVSRATLSLQCGETSDEVWGPTGGVPDLVREDGALAARVVADLPVIKAQVLQSARSEMAVQLADLVMRRTPLYLSELLDDAVLAEVATLAARELRWSTADIADQVRNARTELQKFRGPASLGPHSGASRVPDNLSLSLT